MLFAAVRGLGGRGYAGVSERNEMFVGRFAVNVAFIFMTKVRNSFMYSRGRRGRFNLIISDEKREEKLLILANQRLSVLKREK